MWHGVDRSRYEWYPVIDYDACTGCGMCLLTCGNGVFKWSLSENAPIVADPGSCVLGCTTCGKLCPEDAITFPGDPREFIGKIVRENRIFPAVRMELDERLKRHPDHVVEEGPILRENEGANGGFDRWHGIARDCVDWHPTVDESRCVGCGLCVVTCSEKRNVFGFDLKNRNAVVISPNNCMVGCDNCRAACLWNAISFPDPSQLRELVDSLVSDGAIRDELEGRLASGGDAVRTVISRPPTPTGNQPGQRAPQRVGDRGGTVCAMSIERTPPRAPAPRRARTRRRWLSCDTAQPSARMPSASPR
ncbi:Ferredoxin [Conexivisphaera calida]|uniref:Ferredoxin n=2 Tax=Conexivisphaera calida TaxID=1874277 RepID=A0A4P2VGQ2_9ARCH|nr:Ferredoxin [Conexivisphaera calida]